MLLDTRAEARTTVHRIHSSTKQEQPRLARSSPQLHLTTSVPPSTPLALTRNQSHPSGTHPFNHASARLARLVRQPWPFRNQTPNSNPTLQLTVPFLIRSLRFSLSPLSSTEEPGLLTPPSRRVSFTDKYSDRNTTTFKRSWQFTIQHTDHRPGRTRKNSV